MAIPALSVALAVILIGYIRMVKPIATPRDGVGSGNLFLTGYNRSERTSMEDEYENPNYHLVACFWCFRSPMRASVTPAIAILPLWGASNRRRELDDGGRFKRMASEERMEDFDVEETNNMQARCPVDLGLRSGFLTADLHSRFLRRRRCTRQ